MLRHKLQAFIYARRSDMLPYTDILIRYLLLICCAAALLPHAAARASRFSLREDYFPRRYYAMAIQTMICQLRHFATPPDAADIA